MKKIGSVVVILLMLCLAIFVYWHFYAPRTLNIQTPFGVVSFKVERALTESSQKKGLMYRTHLDKDRGMIFLFTPNRIAYMWMKNTKIPLDMLFFDRFGNVVYIHPDSQPEDLTIISSKFPVAGVLEINAGIAKELGIILGSRLDLENVK